MKKIALIKNQLHSQGGLEKQSSFLTKALIEKGYTPHLLSQTIVDKPINNLSHIALPSHAKGSSKKLKEFDKACKAWLIKNQPDIILGFDRTSNQTHIRAGNGCHKAYMQRRWQFDPFFKRLSLFINPIHKTVLEIEKKALEAPCFKKLIVNSHMVKEEFIKHYQVDPSKIVVIHNGVEFDQIGTKYIIEKDEKDHLAKLKELNSKKYQFLFIGNGYYRKGLTKLLFALSTLKEKDFELSIIGKEKREKSFMHLANRLGLSKKVHFFGFQKDLTPFFQLSDGMVIPSIYDPFANVTVEALSYGLFTISSTFNGGKEVINETNGAIIEDLASRQAFQKALTKAFENKKTKKSSEKIRQSVKHLSFSKQMNQLMHILFDE